MYSTVRSRWLGPVALIAGTGIAAVVGSVAPSAAATTTTTQLPVFAVQRSGLDPQQASALGQAFGLGTVQPSPDGTVRFVDRARFQYIPTIDGGAGRADEDGPTTLTRLDYPALARLTVLAPEVATSRTQTKLQAVGLSPTQLNPGGATATSDHTTLETVDTKGSPISSTRLDTATWYSFTLAGLPYEGPGAKIRVTYAGDGRVTQLAYATRILSPAGTVAVADRVTGVHRCARWLPPGAQVTADYVYEAPPLTTVLQMLTPSFRCSGTNVDGAALQITYVPAALDAVLPPKQSPPTQPRPDSNPAQLTAAPTTAAIASGDIDVGSEGTGECSGLPHTDENLDSFNDEFDDHGVPVRFSWLDSLAWETDFKDPSLGGADTTWTDDVDLAYWQGHGSATGFYFTDCSNHNDNKLAHTDARWGNGDADWMSLFTCLVLDGVAGNSPWWERWGPAFRRLHQINSYDTVANHSAVHGGIYADYLLDDAHRVRIAWALASIDTQPSDKKWASMGPGAAGGYVNIDDHFHGRGSVSPDVYPNDITNYWYLRGSS